MIIDILEILIPYYLGCLVTYLITRPVREWEKGYECAKARYKNYDLGFDEGYKCARNHFQNYDEGFGAGFEAGWDSALRNHEQEDE